MIRLPLAAAILALALAAPVIAAERSAHVNYVLRCLGCHLEDGSGLPSAGIPDFVGKVGVFGNTPQGRAYLFHVPGVINSGLSNAELADLLNYIMELYAGASLPDPWVPFTPEEVAVLRAEDIGNVVAYRRKLAAELRAQGYDVADYPWP